MSNIGYIYKLYDNTNGNVYYGSTTKTVGARISHHKYQTKKSQNKCKSSSIIQNGDYSYNVEEKVMFDEKWELLKRERWYIENNNCINKCIPNNIRDNPNYQKDYNREYYEANRGKILDYKKDYREANKDKIIIYQKEYREANKDKKKSYYEANKDKIKANQKEYRERRRQNKPEPEPEPETNMIINETELLNE